LGPPPPARWRTGTRRADYTGASGSECIKGGVGARARRARARRPRPGRPGRAPLPPGRRRSRRPCARGEPPTGRAAPRAPRADEEPCEAALPSPSPRGPARERPFPPPDAEAATARWTPSPPWPRRAWPSGAGGAPAGGSRGRRGRVAAVAGASSRRHHRADASSAAPETISRVLRSDLRRAFPARSGFCALTSESKAPTIQNVRLSVSLGVCQPRHRSNVSPGSTASRLAARPAPKPF
jgi:hypothetical protein